MRDCFIGIDLGTSGCRAVAIDADGRPLGEARRPLPPSQRPAADASEQRPSDWWDTVVAVLTELAGRRPGRVRAISVDGTSSSLLLCDRDGVPCTPALMYDDRRAGHQAALIGRVAPADSAALGPGSALARLLYLLDAHPGTAAAHALHQADWIAGRLTGRYGVADENNVLKLGYDPVARAWPDWMNGLPLPMALLPRVHPVGHVIGPLSPSAAAACGLPGDVRVVAGTTDSNAAALAAGIRQSGDAVTSLGSTLVLKVLADAPVFAARYGVYSHRIGGHWLVGGASNTGGCVLRQYFTDDELSRLSERIDPARPTGLDYYPLPRTGERFPYSDPTLTARMTPHPDDPAIFLQAILEGIADIEAIGYARLAELGAPPPRHVFTSGGGAVNETWRRIRERRLGLPVTRAAHTEAAYGSALLARAAITGGSTAQLP